MDAPSRKPKKRRSGGKGRQVIRSFFTFLIIVVLAGTSIYNYLQLEQLKQTNANLVAANSALKKELSRHRGTRLNRYSATTMSGPLDPVQDAQMHLSKAETALTQGNIGVAVVECKTAAGEIQTASASTSADVRANVSKLKAKLDAVQQQTTSLWQKLGA